MLDDLTKEVLRAQAGNFPKKHLLDRIALLVYAFPRRAASWDLERCAEFYLFFQPRIERLVDRFRYTGTPFAHLLNASLKWQMKTFARLRTEQSVLDQVAESQTAYNASACVEGGDGRFDYEPVDEQPGPEEMHLKQQELETLQHRAQTQPLPQALRKRLLFLTLKCCHSVSDELAAKVATSLNYPLEQLQNHLLTLRAQLEARRQRHDRVRQIRHEAFSRQHQALCLTETDPSVGERQRWSRRAEFYGRRRANSDRELARLSLTPTNAEIATVLDLPKGSVDSGLHHLKKNWQPIYPEANNLYI